MGTDIVSIYIFVQFMRSIPISLDEAATLDGANHFTIYRRVIFPLLKPAIATVSSSRASRSTTSSTSRSSTCRRRTWASSRRRCSGSAGRIGTQWEILSAGALLVIIPTLIVFLALQRYIYNGLSAGATK